ncbi:Homeodomain-like [Lasallia pustulata]|uniref:Homeodomain-like n=1 Tax=Lasallia pustulata TaxID=136370 RepID=A0A1W5DDB9_9LECA|nr:Homeodomain-like [Lasallia pustulata]
MNISSQQIEADDPSGRILEGGPSESSPSEHSESSIEDFSSAQSKKRKSRPSPGKRKLQAPKPPKSRIKRLKVFYNDDYRKLFNDTTHDVREKDVIEDHNLLPPSQIGATKWSSEEKHVFFSALEKRGRDDVSTIAASIGTKSEMEVRVFLQLLNQATLEQHLYERHHQLLGTFDLPGAFEISPNCCEALEQAADALGILQQKHEEKREKRKHPDLWLLNNGVAEWVDQCLNGNDEGHAEVREILPAAELLNLQSLLQLSMHVFMNSNEPENNWRSCAERRDTPSILYTAFSDFHNLVNSVARRLVQSSLYFAMARLRATDSSNYTHNRAVRRRDVTAALNVLGMEASSHNFWVNCARRCKLDVYHDIKLENAEEERLSYEEVERELDLSQAIESDCKPLSKEENATLVSQGEKQHKRPSSVDEADYRLPHHRRQESEYSSDRSSKASSTRSILDSSSESGGTQLQLERDQDNYSEAFDNQVSLVEEHRLWNMLGRESTPDIKPEEGVLPKRAVIERTRRDELIEWRDWVRYKSEWETLGPPIPANTFYENRKRGVSAGETGKVIRRESRDGPGRRDLDYDASDESIKSDEGGGLSGDSGELSEKAESEGETASLGDSTNMMEEDANEEEGLEDRSADEHDKKDDADSVAEDEAASEGSINGLAEQNANEQLEDSTDSPRESSNDMEVDL